MKIIFIKIFLLICLLPVVACSEPRVSANTVEECIADADCVWHYFERIAFGDEFENSSKAQVIKKWIKDPVIVAVMGENRENFIPMVEEHLAQIRFKTNIPIRMWQEGDVSSEIGVIFTSDFEKAIYKTYRKSLGDVYEKKGKDRDTLLSTLKKIRKQEKSTDGVVNCFGHLLMGLEQNIILEITFIKSNIDNRSIKRCIQEEITQSLGLANDAYNLPFTKFNDSEITTKMTNLDWFLLKTLYHPDFKSGMNKAEAKRVFYNIYNEIRKGEI